MVSFAAFLGVYILTVILQGKLKTINQAWKNLSSDERQVSSTVSALCVRLEYLRVLQIRLAHVAVPVKAVLRDCLH